MKTIEELLRFSAITPSEEYAITEVFEDYERQINTIKAENSRLLEEKAKLIEAIGIYNAADLGSSFPTSILSEEHVRKINALAGKDLKV